MIIFFLLFFDYLGVVGVFVIMLIPRYPSKTTSPLFEVILHPNMNEIIAVFVLVFIPEVHVSDIKTTTTIVTMLNINAHS